MSRTANTLYERTDLIKQVNKEIKPGLSFSLFAYFCFMIFALVVDFESIKPFQDLILRTNEWTGKILSASFVFLVDVLVPISLTKLVKSHFNQKKLNTVLIISILSSIGIPMIILCVQKMLGTNIMMPDRGTTVTVPQNVKFVTQLLFSILPFATTVGLTVMGLLRENIKIFRKKRYIQLARAEVMAEKEHIKEALDTDFNNLAKRDDSKFVSSLAQLFTMVNTLFSRSREMLALNIKSPAATEQIINSTPVYRASAQYNYMNRHVMCNPAVHVVFEEIENTFATEPTSKNPNVSIQKKEEVHHEKQSA